MKTINKRLLIASFLLLSTRSLHSSFFLTSIHLIKPSIQIAVGATCIALSTTTSYYCFYAEREDKKILNKLNISLLNGLSSLQSIKNTLDDTSMLLKAAGICSLGTSYVGFRFIRFALKNIRSLFKNKF